MVSSGHLRRTVYVNPTDVILSDKDTGLIDAMHSITHSRYSILQQQYNQVLRRATNSRGKSTFPSFSSWEPPGGYQEEDTELLQGPGQTAASYKRLQIECPSTGRQIIHSAALSEFPKSRHSYSYVRVLNEESTSIPVFGQIQKILSHKFGKTNYHIAILKQFDDAHQDNDWGLWFVDSSNYHRVAILMEDISNPLSVAFDSTMLWFLTVS